jgi:hypothetical protein
MRTVDIRCSMLGFAVGVLLTVGAIGCGDSESDQGSASDARADSGEQEIRTTLQRMGKRMGAGDGAGACEYMTAAARQQMAAGIKRLAEIDRGVAARGGGRGTCGAAFGAILGGNFIEDVDPRILSVEIDGDRAVVTARVSHDDRTLQKARLAREGGAWKVVEWFVHRGGSNTPGAPTGAGSS